MHPPTSWLRRHFAVIAGLVAPAAVCAVLVPFRTSFRNTDAALVLVAVIVAVAALGNRAAGALAALSAGVWFDFFLTRPYESFSINARASVETTVLLLLIGLAVTELAARGRLQRYRAGQQAGYLAGLHEASEAVAAGGSPTRLASQVADQLSQVLGLADCHFHFGTGMGNPRLRHDGTLTWDGHPWDVDAKGLPPDVETELLVTAGGRYQGRFLMTPLRDSKPNLSRRLVAVSLADQVGASLGTYDGEDG